MRPIFYRIIRSHYMFSRHKSMTILTYVNGIEYEHL